MGPGFALVALLRPFRVRNALLAWICTNPGVQRSPLKEVRSVNPVFLMMRDVPAGFENLSRPARPGRRVRVRTVPAGAPSAFVTQLAHSVMTNEPTWRRDERNVGDRGPGTGDAALSTDTVKVLPMTFRLFIPMLTNH